MRLVWRRLAGGYLTRGLAGPGVVPASGVPAPVPSYLPEPPERPRPPCRPRVYRDLACELWTWRCRCGDSAGPVPRWGVLYWRHAYRSAVEHVCDRKLRDGMITINRFRWEMGMRPAALAVPQPDYDD